MLNDFIYNFWINNYYNYSFEYNANMISLKKIQQFIYELNDFKIQYCSKNLKYQNSNLRKIKKRKLCCSIQQVSTLNNNEGRNLYFVLIYLRIIS